MRSIVRTVTSESGSGADEAGAGAGAGAEHLPVTSSLRSLPLSRYHHLPISPGPSMSIISSGSGCSATASENCCRLLEQLSAVAAHSTPLLLALRE
uniref:VAN3-binding protein-like auxin canalisation domain-containing protein n=1 Tax=Setaria digitata TaxID=48799 RepID=A0A915PXT7_9BILA